DQQPIIRDGELLRPAGPPRMLRLASSTHSLLVLALTHLDSLARREGAATPYGEQLRMITQARCFKTRTWSQPLTATQGSAGARAQVRWHPRQNPRMKAAQFFASFRQQPLLMLAPRMLRQRIVSWHRPLRSRTRLVR